MIQRIAVSITLLLTAFLTLSAAEQSPAASALDDPGENTNLNDYVISASDLLRFQVYQEEDLTREVRVSQAGNITLPLVGTVEVKGKTIGEAQRDLTERYDADFLVEPQINLSVVEYSRRRVSVLGYVNSPGVVLFPPEESMTLIDAIAGAGGFQRNANSRRVILTRTAEDGRTERFNIDADEIIQGNSGIVWELQRDDVIYVPQRLF